MVRVKGAIETLQDITDRKRAEEAAVKSELRYRTFLDFVPYPIAVFNMKGRTTYLNGAFTQVFGWRLDELKDGKLPFIPSGREQETRDIVKKLIEEKSVLRYESKRLTKDGRILDVVTWGVLIFEDIDKPAAELVIYRGHDKRKAD